jgi:hypothetical protein
VILTNIWWPVKKRLIVSKQQMQISFRGVKSQTEVEAKEQYHAEISNRFTALENLNSDMDINIGWETIFENINISAK